jgi:hypothetical protein
MTHKRTTRLSRRQFLKAAGAAAGALAAGPVLSACGPAATVAPTATASPPLKIGILLPYSDIYARLGRASRPAWRCISRAWAIRRAGGRSS